MDYREIAYEEHDEIRVLRFDRPEVMNCVGPRTHLEGLRRFRERDHPDRRPGGPSRTPGIVRDGSG